MESEDIEEKLESNTRLTWILFITSLVLIILGIGIAIAIAWAIDNSLHNDNIGPIGPTGHTGSRGANDYIAVGFSTGTTGMVIVGVPDPNIGITGSVIPFNNRLSGNNRLYTNNGFTPTTVGTWKIDYNLTTIVDTDGQYAVALERSSIGSPPSLIGIHYYVGENKLTTISANFIFQVSTINSIYRLLIFTIGNPPPTGHLIFNITTNNSITIATSTASMITILT